MPTRVCLLSFSSARRCGKSDYLPTASASCRTERPALPKDSHGGVHCNLVGDGGPAVEFKPKGHHSTSVGSGVSWRSIPAASPHHCESIHRPTCMASRVAVACDSAPANSTYFLESSAACQKATRSNAQRGVSVTSADPSACVPRHTPRRKVLAVFSMVSQRRAAAADGFPLSFHADSSASSASALDTRSSPSPLSFKIARHVSTSYLPSVEALHLP